MKNKMLLKLVAFALFCTVTKIAISQIDNQSLKGAWKFESDTAEQILVFQDDYISQTSYNIDKKKFYYTRGGRASVSANTLQINIEFNSADKNEVGTNITSPVTIAGETLTTRFGGMEQKWTRVDDGSKNLAGCWRINGRWDGKTMNEIKAGPRKTLKLLSGTRFQWFAINTETKEFFGTGGGTYTFSNGKYTENIEFFSRDNSRVGATLSFDAKLENGVWHHSGLSSKGDPIRETWVR